MMHYFQLEFKAKNEQTSPKFFYGSFASLAMLGFYTDFLAQRNLYTLLTSVITI
jgi:hypothetical protein